MRNKPRAVFMAFGTKGDVYPIAAIAAAFARDQEQYNVLFITHSAHENLAVHLAAKTVAYVPITSPPVLSHFEDNGSSGSAKLSFSLEKKKITEKHRKECASAVEKIFSNGPSMEGDFIVINFFALEGWCLAELFQVRCFIAAPYVVPYSAPSSFERRFMEELPLLYKYFQEAPFGKVCWKDVIHWMWPLFTEDWGSWRSVDLNLSPWPFTDPVTGVPTWHHRIPSPLLLYGFSKEVVECPGYWPSNARVCGFWFLPMEWQFSCNKCCEVQARNSPGHLNNEYQLCSSHVGLQSFLDAPASVRPVFIGLSSVGSMGFLRNPHAFLKVLKTVLEKTSHRFILFSAGYEPLDVAIKMVAAEASSCSEQRHSKDGVCLYSGRLFYFSGTIPYSWLFPRCIAAIHHGGSGSTAVALHAGIPQVICPCMLDQFYWAERMFWLGVAPEPLKRVHLLPDQDEEKDIGIAANMLARAINCTLSPDIQARALEIAGRLYVEDGVLEAVKILKGGISQSDFW